MKKFSRCPICKSGMTKHATGRLYEERCDMLSSAEGCPIGFRRYFQHSTADEDITYIVFVTKDYLVYSYFEGNTFHDNGKPYSPDFQTHVYHRQHSKTVESPVFTFKHLKIDFDKLHVLNQRFRKLDLFT